MGHMKTKNVLTWCCNVQRATLSNVTLQNFGANDTQKDDTEPNDNNLMSWSVQKRTEEATIQTACETKGSVAGRL